jgi:hypothetical protein
LSEVKEKQSKIQNQIQASSLQVVAKFSLTEETPNALLSEGVENHPVRDSKPEKPKLDEAPSKL